MPSVWQICTNIARCTMLLLLLLLLYCRKLLKSIVIGEKAGAVAAPKKFSLKQSQMGKLREIWLNFIFNMIRTDADSFLCAL